MKIHVPVSFIWFLHIFSGSLYVLKRETVSVGGYSFLCYYSKYILKLFFPKFASSELVWLWNHTAFKYTFYFYFKNLCIHHLGIIKSEFIPPDYKYPLSSGIWNLVDHKIPPTKWQAFPNPVSSSLPEPLSASAAWHKWGSTSAAPFIPRLMDRQALSLGVSEMPAKVAMIMLWHYAISQIQEENLSTQCCNNNKENFYFGVP